MHRPSLHVAGSFERRGYPRVAASPGSTPQIILKRIHVNCGGVVHCLGAERHPAVEGGSVHDDNGLPRIRPTARTSAQEPEHAGILLVVDRTPKRVDLLPFARRVGLRRRGVGFARGQVILSSACQQQAAPLLDVATHVRSSCQDAWIRSLRPRSVPLLVA